MRNIGFASLAIASAAAAAPLHAEELGYNYVQAFYQSIDIDVSGISVDGDGFGIGGSFEVTDILHVSASFSTADYDYDLESETLAAGVGVHLPISDAADFLISAAFGNTELEGPGGSIDSDVINVGVGVRGYIAPRIEAEAELAWVDYDEGYSDTGFSVGALYHVTQQLGLGGTFATIDDTDTISLGARVYF